MEIDEAISFIKTQKEFWMYIDGGEESSIAKSLEMALSALHAQQEAKSSSGWISVKDRLPEKRGEYLCYFRYPGIDVPSLNFICDVICQNTYQGSGRWMSDMNNVTHWMPLPAPPKEDKADERD